LNNWYHTIRMHPSGHFYEKASEAPEIPLGQSRIGGPIIDLPEGFEHPENMFFVAQLDLAWLSPCDKAELLPEKGFLFFFYNFLLEKDDFRQLARIHFFPGTVEQLRRTVREHQSWFWRGTTLVGCTAEEEDRQDRYKPDGRWDYFAGMKKTKINGYPSNPQWSEREVARALDSDSKMVLLQVGEDWTSPRMVDTQLRVYNHPWRSIMARTRRTYTPEFKAEAVKLITQQGYSVAEAARSLGICDNLLRNWKQALETQGEQAFPGRGKLSPFEEENRRLCAENKRLLAERAVLKKAAAFFAREAT
jgi:transposase